MIAGKATNKEKPLVRAARNMRYAAYRSIAPLDYSFRVVNQIGQYPPLHLRRHVGGMSAGFNGPSYELVAYLRLLAQLRDGDRLWDLACGCGLLELALNDLGWQGQLVGSDIHKPSIDWAQKHLGTRFSGHKFVHMDIYSPAYYPKGKLNAQEWLDSFVEKEFDVAVAKSLFTHLLPEEVDIYLRGIADRLKIGGKALLTFFILNEEQQRLAALGKNRMLFHPYSEDKRCAVYRPLAPTAAVAYEQNYLEKRLREAGFKVEGWSRHHGAWTGRPDALSFQDIIVVEKASGS
jgi:SAM-dependent methyltransferase